MAKLTKPPIPLKMYKHFAVVTLMLTAGIAMFADSDNREAMAQHIDDRQRDAELREISAERVGNGELVRRDRRQQGSFGSEESGYGEPTLVTPTNGGGSRRARRPGSARQSIPGYSRSDIEALSESQYRALVASLPEDQRVEPASEQDQRSIEAASARRAGRSGPRSDAPG